MNILEASFLDHADKEDSMQQLSGLLDGLVKNKIENAPWPSYSYMPEAFFSLGYTDHSILIKYFVREKFIRAKYKADNDPVYEDSCVEFFISFNEEDDYYNFEFNCIGACLLGFGKDRTERKFLPEHLIQKIKHLTYIKNSCESGNDIFEWELTIMIPFEVFSYHHLKSLKGQTAKVNFFKCGDELPEPHFLAWKNIIAASPNFHLPQFFGTMQFV